MLLDIKSNFCKITVNVRSLDNKGKSKGNYQQSNNQYLSKSSKRELTVMKMWEGTVSPVTESEIGYLIRNTANEQWEIKFEIWVTNYNKQSIYSVASSRSDSEGSSSFERSRKKPDKSS
jgi:hypothetical protein